MPTLTGSLVRYPARTSFYWYLGILLIGTAILRHPVCGGNVSKPISWLDALFTATSALCVTGLSVRSTPNDFSLLGQLVILVLIQIGGIGIMTMTTFFLVQLGGRAGLRQQVVVAETLGAAPSANLNWIVARVFLFAVGIELVGTVLLLPRFLTLSNWNWPIAIWLSVFHSVSAFCNAGFALYDSNLMDFKGDYLVNLAIMGLIISGGIGFPVLSDLMRWIRNSRTTRLVDLRLHTKLTLITTGILIVVGALVLGLIEANGMLVGASWSECLLIPIFQSVTCRTAGFNTVDLADLSSASLFIMILLMVVGAGACSTAGGIKVGTISMLFLHAASRLQGKQQVQVFRRTIPETIIDRCMATVMLYLVVAATALTLLSLVEQGDMRFRNSDGTFLAAMFEVVSALSTVGLSTGLTPKLCDMGKLILIALMFFGRLGPLSVFAALTMDRKNRAIQYATEEPLVG